MTITTSWILLIMLSWALLIDVIQGFSVTRTSACIKQPCQHGGICRSLASNKYKCQCPRGYKGENCEYTDRCLINPCLHNGTCTQTGEHQVTCECREGFSGPRCTVPPIYPCSIGNPCANDGTCQNINSMKFRCICKKGFTGTRCEEDINECMSNPCLNGGICGDKIGYFICTCYNLSFTGDRCEKPTTPKTEAIRKPVVKVTPKPAIIPTTLKLITVNYCEQNDCLQKAKNNICDNECNTFDCGFDGGDCNSPLWKECNDLGLSEQICQKTFANGECDPQCNRRECHFDGFDCSPKRPKCKNSNYCRRVFNDGICQPECHSSECANDGGDCHGRREIIKGEIRIILSVNTSEQFLSQQKGFLFQLSVLLRSVAKIKQEKGEDLINFNPLNREIKITVQLDTAECKESGCIRNEKEAKDFIKASLAMKTYEPLLPIVDVTSEKKIINELEQPTPKFIIYTTLIICSIVLSVVVLLMVVQKKFKRQKKIKTPLTWFPTSATSTATSSLLEKSVEHGASIYASGGGQNHNVGVDRMMSSGGVSGGSNSSSDTSYFRCETLDPLLTNKKKDTSAPLMTSSMFTRRNIGECTMMHPGLGPTSLATTLHNTDGLHPTDSQRLLILDSVLKSISAGDSDINEPINEYGETALHLAARLNSGSDVIQRLLDAGADMQARDEHNYRPLATAAAANAVESTQELLKKERDLQKSLGGRGGSRTTSDAIPIPVTGSGEKRGRIRPTELRETTPLIAAVKTGCEYMALLLLNEGVPINSIDENGRNVLHWAAATNSVEVMRKLFLLRGTLKMIDHKDDMDRTALFLAVREGSFDACELLLDYKASVNIPDHTDTLPYQEALHKGHLKVYNLLQLRCPDLTIPEGTRPLGPSSVFSPSLSPPNLTSATSLSDSSPEMKSTPPEVTMDYHKFDSNFVFSDEAQTPSIDFSSVDFFSNNESELI